MLGLPADPGPTSFPLKPFLLLSDETGKVIATKFFDMYEGGKKTCLVKMKTKLCRPHRETESFFFSSLFSFGLLLLSVDSVAFLSTMLRDISFGD